MLISPTASLVASVDTELAKSTLPAWIKAGLADLGYTFGLAALRLALAGLERTAPRRPSLWGGR